MKVNHATLANVKLSLAAILAPACAVAWLALTVPVTAQTCTTVLVDCLQPTALAQAGGARFAWGSTGDETPDAWVARFDGGAEEPTWRVPLGGSGDDSISTVTLNRGGAELLVAGATTSPILKGFAGRNSGGRDGFVARLDAATGRVLSGAFVGGSGDEELSGVVTDSAGNVLVAGVGMLPSFGEPPATLTVTEPDGAVGPGSPVFLATLDRTLTRERTLYDLGSIRVKRPRLWIDCHGSLVVGVTALKTTSNCNGGPGGSWPDLVYARDQITQAFLDDLLMDHTLNNPATGGNPPGGWGYHALRWKQHHANATAPTVPPIYDLDWGSASVPIPKYGSWNQPGCSNLAALNQLQKQIYPHPLDPDEPPGGWLCGNHANMAQLAVFAAHFFHRWKTPVYTRFLVRNPSLQELKPYAAGLDRVIFEPVCPINPNGYQGEKIESLCALEVDNVNDLNCPINVGIPGLDGGSFQLLFKRFEGSNWGPSTVLNWFTALQMWFSSVTPSLSWYEPGQYVMDPPTHSETELSILQEATRQSAGLVMRPGTVRVTQLAKGVPTCTQTVEAILPASE